MKKEKPLKELIGYAGDYKYLTYLSWVVSAISAVIALIPFVYIWLIIRNVINASPNYAQAENITLYGWMAVLFSVLAFIVNFAGLMCSHLSAFRIAKNMRVKTMEHVTQLPLGTVGEQGSGKLRRIVNESSAATETYLAHRLPDFVSAVTTPIAMLILLFVFDWRLGLLSLLPVAVSFVVMTGMTGKKMAEKMKQYQNSLEEMNNQAVEYVRGIPVVKTFGQTVFSFRKFKKSITDYEKWVLSYTKDLRTPMIAFTVILNSVFAVLIVAALIITGHEAVNMEFLLNLIFYIVFTPIIGATLTKIMFMSEDKMIVSDAVSRIHSITDLEPLTESKSPCEPADNSVELKNVSFRYHGAEKDAVHNLSFKVESGRSVALVGPSGGGKTTVAELVARFFDVTNGKVEIGGVDVKEISQKRLSEMVSYVFQDSKLLKTTILENVKLSRPNATNEEVLKAIHLAQCDDIIDKFPQGINTVIGSKGIYLSGGEQQRIAIARAILKNSPILILDEATAFADPENEYLVQKAFEELFKNKTVIMIAHRLTTVKDSDSIIVMKDGCMAESGTHDELIAQAGVYQKMWNDYKTSIEWKVKKEEE